MNPAAVEAMAEVGIDISDQRPKVLTTDAVEASDVVITMGCGDACPIFPGKRYLDWELEDPAGKGVDGGAPDPRRDRDPHPRPDRGARRHTLTSGPEATVRQPRRRPRQARARPIVGSCPAP